MKPITETWRRRLIAALLAAVSAPSIAIASTSDIRSFAWRDATYDFGDGNKVTFSGGAYTDLTPEGECNVCDYIRAITFGDVDGDGIEEALLVVSTNLGGSGTMIYGYVFGLKSGAPVLRAEIEGGDRGEGGIDSMKVKDGVVVVRRFADDGGGGACCPNRIEIEKWRWTGTTLKREGKPTFVRRAPTPWIVSRRRNR